MCKSADNNKGYEIFKIHFVSIIVIFRSSSSPIGRGFLRMEKKMNQKGIAIFTDSVNGSPFKAVCSMPNVLFFMPKITPAKFHIGAS